VGKALGLFLHFGRLGDAHKLYHAVVASAAYTIKFTKKVVINFCGGGGFKSEYDLVKLVLSPPRLPVSISGLHIMQLKPARTWAQPPLDTLRLARLQVPSPFILHYLQIARHRLIDAFHNNGMPFLRAWISALQGM
jgi:hypothetical protein